MPILALRELKERGFAVISLVAGLLHHQPTGVPEVDDIADQLNASMDTHGGRTRDRSTPPSPGASMRRVAASRMAAPMCTGASAKT